MVRSKIRTMNIFALDRDPFIAASYHCDKHVVKMIVEYAQLLSTAHRQLDGTPVTLEWHNRNGSLLSDRKKTLLVLEGETPYIEYEHTTVDGIDVITGSASLLHRLCYNSTHHNHPCAIWARQTDANYHWLAQLFEGVLREYTKRYQKIHATEKLREFFLTPPKHIAHGQQTPFALAMPDEYKVDDEILSYQNYYVGDKARFAKWTNTTVPKWFLHRVDKDESHFARTNPIL